MRRRNCRDSLLSVRFEEACCHFAPPKGKMLFTMLSTQIQQFFAIFCLFSTNLRFSLVIFVARPKLVPFTYQGNQTEFKEKIDSNGGIRTFDHK
jgi:hypothetical protein